MHAPHLGWCVAGQRCAAKHGGPAGPQARAAPRVRAAPWPSIRAVHRTQDVDGGQAGVGAGAGGRGRGRGQLLLLLLLRWLLLLLLLMMMMRWLLLLLLRWLLLLLRWLLLLLRWLRWWQGRRRWRWHRLLLPLLRLPLLHLLVELVLHALHLLLRLLLHAQSTRRRCLTLRLLHGLQLPQHCRQARVGVPAHAGKVRRQEGLVHAGAHACTPLPSCCMRVALCFAHCLQGA